MIICSSSNNFKNNSKFYYSISLFICLIIASLCNIAFAYDDNQSDQWGEIPEYLKDFQISIAFGGSILKVNNGDFGPINSDKEYDSVVVNRATRQLNTKIGIGYNLFTDKLSRNKFLTNLLVEINFYNFYGSAYGEFWVDRNPELDKYAFTLGINSKRFMLDVKPSLFTYHGFSPYLVLGAGISLLDTTLDEEFKPSVDSVAQDRRFKYQHYTNRKLVVEGGGGLNYVVNDHFGVFLEYLYTRFGSISAATPLDKWDNKLIPSCPKFGNTYTNSMLFGLYVKI